MQLELEPFGHLAELVGGEGVAWDAHRLVVVTRIQNTPDELTELRLGAVLLHPRDEPVGIGSVAAERLGLLEPAHGIGLLARIVLAPRLLEALRRSLRVGGLHRRCLDCCGRYLARDNGGYGPGKK